MKTATSPVGELLLLYSRPAGRFSAEDAQVAAIAEPFGAAVRLLRTSPWAMGSSLRAWVSRRLPSLLILRDGEVLGGAIGYFPLDELQGLVARALAG